MMRDINARFLRARFPDYAPEKVEQVLDELERDRAARIAACEFEDLLRLPDRRFFRRKGEPAWTMVGVDGETFTDADEYLRYLASHLPEAYLASRDMKLYAETLRKVAAGELTGEGRDHEDAEAQARRRHLPVLEVGALGGGGARAGPGRHRPLSRPPSPRPHPAR